MAGRGSAGAGIFLSKVRGGRPSNPCLSFSFCPELISLAWMPERPGETRTHRTQRLPFAKGKHHFPPEPVVHPRAPPMRSSCLVIQGAKQSGSLARSLSDCFTLNCPRAEMLSAGWIPSPAGQRAAKPVADSSCPGSGHPAPVLRESGASEIRRVTCPLKLEPSVGKAYSW